MKKANLVFLITIVLIGLSSCGPGKKIITTDDSANYKASVNLQPLKRPPNALDSEKESAIENSIMSEIVNRKKGMARLVIKADFDQAWAYVANNLKTTDLTVFSRNKAAGRFDIGCANLSVATKAKKKSWSFSKRDKLKQSEHCALEVIEKRGKSSVLVLNRLGEEVAGDLSKAILEKISSR